MSDRGTKVMLTTVLELTNGLDRYDSTSDRLILIQFVGSLEEVTEEGQLVHLAVSTRVIL